MEYAASAALFLGGKRNEEGMVGCLREKGGEMKGTVKRKKKKR
jgi:hypothetical protein